MLCFEIVVCLLLHMVAQKERSPVIDIFPFACRCSTCGNTSLLGFHALVQIQMCFNCSVFIKIQQKAVIIFNTSVL